ncbi:MAG: outer membrane beta-barrel protein [Pseudomonadota bacterium]
MNKPIKKSLLSMAFVIPLLSGAAQAMDSGLTLSLDAGQAESRDACDNVVNCESDDSTVRGALGYNFNDMIGLEVGYTSFGTVFDSSSNNNTAGFAAKQDANAITASVIGAFPVGERFGIFGRAGVARFDNDKEVQGVPVDSDDRTKPYFGAGLKFGLTDNFALRGEYQRYKDLADIDGIEDDVDAWTGGVVFTF